MIFRFRISFPCSHWNVSLMICGECTVDACTGGLFHVEIVSKIRFTRTHTLHHQPLRTILIQSQSISIQFNLSQIIIQKTFSNHLQPQGIIPSFNDSQGLHETESPNCRYPCSDCYTSHTNQLHALDFVCCHGKIHVFLLSSIYIYICSSKSYPKTSNEIIKVYHKSNLIAFSILFREWNTSQIYHKLSKSGMYVGKCSPTLTLEAM